MPKPKRLYLLAHGLLFFLCWFKNISEVWGLVVSFNNKNNLRRSCLLLSFARSNDRPQSGGSEEFIGSLPLSPIPVMPSPQFQELAMSQLELLASSIPSKRNQGRSKIKSMALYLPQENSSTGQLEFLPAILYPHPSQDRVFIANEADSGVAPSLPRALTTLPGFAHATSLLPDYPMVSGGFDAGVGVVEEVMCDLTSGAPALSVPLFSGSQTVGVLLVCPHGGKQRSTWSQRNREQVGKAAKSLSLALSMDTERKALQLQNEQVAQVLSDSLHQLKNPLQAMRTYGKLLQRRLVEEETPEMLEMADNLLVQSDRLVERLKPVDSIADTLSASFPAPLLNPAPSKDLVHIPTLPWENETLQYARKTVGKSSTLKASKQETIEFTPSNAMITSPYSPPPNDASVPSLVEKEEMEMTFLDDFLRPIISAFRVMAEEQGLDFHYNSADDLSGVFVRLQALQEALVNVIDNAFTYVHTATSPKVRIRLVPNLADKSPGVTILIEDNGSGIEPTERDLVFERGYRSERFKENINGSGIGLDIARELVESMGGSLQVVSNDRYPECLEGAILELTLYRSPP